MIRLSRIQLSLQLTFKTLWRIKEKTNGKNYDTKLLLKLAPIF